MTAIQSTLGHISIGEPVGKAELIMYPLLDPAAGESEYVLASEALDQGTLEVTEVSESGSVQNLQVTNNGSRPVLLLDGEEFEGAKQNRILNVTVMVAAKQTITVPVSCVEVGRWAYRSKRFGAADWVMDTQGRAMQMRSVSESLRSGSRAGNQGAVWAHIDGKAERLDAMSPTGAMSEMYAKHRKRLDDSVRSLEPVEHQVGAAFMSQGRLMGVELFDSPNTLKAVLPKLVRSHALDSIDPRTDRREQGADTIDDLLASLGSLESEDYPAVGLGQEFRLHGESLEGAALVVEERVVHLEVLGA